MTFSRVVVNLKVIFVTSIFSLILCLGYQCSKYDLNEDKILWTEHNIDNSIQMRQGN